MRVTILGCGHSGGVPLIMGNWGACDPTNPRNRRRRASIAVQRGETTLVVDTSPDLKEQCLSAQLTHIDAVLYTHDHADHTHGVDDLRPFSYSKNVPIPVYGEKNTLDFLKFRFEYAFATEDMTPDIYRAFVTPHLIEGPFQVGDILAHPFAQGHGYSTSIGYRFEKIAYSTDVVELDEKAFAVLEGVDVWIVDCLDRVPKPTHAHLAKTLEWIERVKPRQAYLTHMSHFLDYETLVQELPEGVAPAYDGLVIEV